MQKLRSAPLACTVDSYALSQRGPWRAASADCFAIVELFAALHVARSNAALESLSHDPTVRRCFVVADGRGAEAARSDASLRATRTLLRGLSRSLPRMIGADCRLDAIDTELRRVFVAATLELTAGPSPGAVGLTTAYVCWPWLAVAHLGSSRCYVLRRAGLERLTPDHGEPARRGPLVPELSHTSLESGDALVLATDGLLEHVDEETLRDCLLARTSARAVCRDLVDGALEAGAEDDLTALVARFQAPPAANPEDTVARGEPHELPAM